ncbi:hypothetical protein GCM10009809_28910 [Isoptericola hypogeus]|uniref:Putative regulatory protein FmdB zinc ribbon domain-containing protein n=1 Tax=Isoptericola hypogeus TaxID=300179 RepID=A0ABN2JLT0_9MICO
MPTYAYRCADCNHVFDVHQAFTDESLTVCPECGGSLRKQYGSVGVTFKGSGFYRTDSRKGASSSTASSSSSGSSSSASTSSSGSGSSGSGSSGSSSSGSSAGSGKAASA